MVSKSRKINFYLNFFLTHFISGFVHCDPHPGNILVRAVNSKPQIVLLDHGQYRELSEDFR